MHVAPMGSALVRIRLEEAAREVGVLLIAFAPLDMAFTDRRSSFGTAALFFAIGALCFTVALVSEKRRFGHA